MQQESERRFSIFYILYDFARMSVVYYSTSSICPQRVRGGGGGGIYYYVHRRLLEI